MKFKNIMICALLVQFVLQANEDSFAWYPQVDEEFTFRWQGINSLVSCLGTCHSGERFYVQNTDEILSLVQSIKKFSQSDYPQELRNCVEPDGQYYYAQLNVQQQYKKPCFKHPVEWIFVFSYLYEEDGVQHKEQGMRCVLDNMCWATHQEEHETQLAQKIIELYKNPLMRESYQKMKRAEKLWGEKQLLYYNTLSFTP